MNCPLEVYNLSSHLILRHHLIQHLPKLIGIDHIVLVCIKPSELTLNFFELLAQMCWNSFKETTELVLREA